MTTVAIRQKLSAYLQVANDKKVKAMYALLEDDIRSSEGISLEQYNKELNEAEEEYQKGDFLSHHEMITEMKKW